MSRTDEIEGLVLCSVGEARIAFAASTVGSIELWEPGGPAALHARSAFGLAPQAGRLLKRTGHSLVVDSLEIVGERHRLWTVPALLSSVAGGALHGFVQAGPALVPLLGLSEFSDFLGRERA